MRWAILLVVALAGVGGVAYLALEGGEAPARRRTAPSRAVEAAPERETPYGSVRGYYSFALRIETAAGDPAAGAQVEYEGPTSGKAAADDRGLLDVGNVAAGLYRLRARLGEQVGSLRFEVTGTLHLGTLRLAGAVEVHGSVFDASGVPLPDALVEATVAEASGSMDPARLAEAMSAPDTVAAQALANSSGSYTLRVPDGALLGFRASTPGYAPHRVPARRVRAGLQIDFQLIAGATVAGVVVDEQGTPVRNASVLLLEPARAFEGVPKVEGRTGPDGSFDLAVLPLSAAALAVRAPNFAPYFRGNLTVPATGLRIILERGFAVRLRVVDEEEREHAIPGVSVAIDLQGGFALGASGADGVVQIPNLPARRDPAAGSDQVLLWGKGYSPRIHAISETIPPGGTLDLGDLPLGRGGEVRGRVLDDESGRPVGGATVRSFGGLPPVVVLIAAPTAQSDPDGTYRLEGVPLEATHLLALHRDYAPPPDLAELLGGQVPPSGGPLFAPGSRVAERDLRLRSGGSVGGVVRSAKGQPVAGARVVAISAAIDAGALFGSARTEVSTDGEGRYVLSRLPPDTEVSLEASHPELGTSPRVPVRAGGEIDLVLSPPVSLRGRIIDEQGQPVRGARVELGAGEATPRFAVTDAAGAYLLRTEVVGAGTLRVSHPDFLPAEREITVAAEQSIDTVTLAHGPGLRGVVLLPGGQPAPGAQVTVVLNEASDLFTSARMWAEVTTDAEGRFALHGLVAGSYRLSAQKTGHFSDEHVAQTDGDLVSITLLPGLTLRGRVTAEGKGVADARVEVVGRGEEEERPLYFVSAADGRFLAEGLPPGVRYDVIVRHDGFATGRSEEVAPGGGEVVIALETGMQIGGSVELEDGTPVPGALVEVRGAGQQPVIVRTTATGRFLAGGLPAEGESTVRLLESGLGFLEGEPVRAAAWERNLRLIARRGEAITGMVVDVNGRPAARVRVDVLDAEGRVLAGDWVETAGRGFAFRGLAPGVYTLRAQQGQGETSQPARAELQGIRAGTSRVELRLEIAR